MSPGLNSAQAAALLERHGPNALPEARPPSLARRFVRQFASPLIYILLFALAVDLILWWREPDGVPLESAVIGLILLLNAGLGVWQESKAESALRRLKALGAPRVWARRDGAWVQLPAAAIVPGDAVRIEAGDRIPADGQLAGAALAVDESILTGESLPVEKSPGDPLAGGTLAVRGKAVLEVTATGARSSLGRLAGLLAGVRQEATPLEKRIRVFGRRVALAVLAIATLLVAAGLASEGMDQAGPVILFAVALAVAAVPEGLPAVLTLALALGVERMARRKAVVRRLAAVEALGSVTVIATDKTGTITGNRLELQRLEPAAGEEGLLEALLLANDAEGATGDPLDVAILDFARARGWDVPAHRRSRPRTSERSFDSGARFMRATVAASGGVQSYLKGAPEVLLARSRLTAAERARWEARAAACAAEGTRVLAAARAAGEAEDGLEFLGLALFWDPPRPEVAAAVERCRAAGIRVMMLTGDHPATALAVARRVGIPAGRVVTGDEFERMAAAAAASAAAGIHVFARVEPHHKLRLVELLQQRGEIVAMTGDGVNDAAALKKSDVGVAMGQRGSDVAREVADLVLLDDNFATIVNAVEEGRGIYENIQKFIRFLFSTNLSEVLVVAVGAALAAWLGLRDAAGALVLPLTAVQILWINLVTDGLPAVALVLDRNPGLMRQRPRTPEAQLLDAESRRFILIAGTLKALFALALLGILPRLGYSLETSRTAVFHLLAAGQLLFAYPARHTGELPETNRWLHAAVGMGVGLQIWIGTWFPAAVGATPLPTPLWGAVLGGAVAAWGAAELVNRRLWGR